MLHRWVALLLLVVGAMLAALPAHAQQPAQLDGHGRIDLQSPALLTLPLGQGSVDELGSDRSAGRFTATADRLIRYRPSSETWVRLTLHNALPRPQTWILEYGLPSIDHVTLFERRRDGAWLEASAGDRVAHGDWPLPGRFPAFKLQFDPGQTRVVLLRARNGFPAPIPLRLLSERVADAADDRSNMGFGLVFGALALIFASCMVQVGLSRDIGYLLYGVYALVLGLAFAALSGVAGQMLWGDLLPWSDTAKSVFPLVGAGIAVWLVRVLCSLRTRNRTLSRVTGTVGTLVVALGALFAALGEVLPWLAALAVLGAAAAVLVTAFLTWRRGDPVGGWILGAHAPLIAVTLLIVCRMFGLTPIEFDANQWLSLAIGIELPLMMIALQLRSRETLALRNRDRELASADALTGLLAAHLFTDRVRSAITRYARRRQNAVIVYVRLVNHARIREMHGAAVADRSMIHSAMKVRRVFPDADCIGRVTEDTIGLILELETDRASVQQAAAKLIAHGLMPLPGLEPQVPLSFHVTACVLSENQLPAGELQAALVALLASMSPRSRRPIRFLEPGPGSAHASSEPDAQDPPPLPIPGATGASVLAKSGSP